MPRMIIATPSPMPMTATPTPRPTIDVRPHPLAHPGSIANGRQHRLHLAA
ncbi:MAG: hypothetical protein M5U34_19070 [Chloroflexi bacterium]|nr:hypothetical protein [Chloroflexota bacterium]